MPVFSPVTVAAPVMVVSNTGLTADPVTFMVNAPVLFTT